MIGERNNSHGSHCFPLLSVCQPDSLELGGYFILATVISLSSPASHLDALLQLVTGESLNRQYGINGASFKAITLGSLQALFPLI